MDIEWYMKVAIKQAETALEEGEFPVGAVVVSEDKIIASSSRRGTLINLNNETDHAEMIALKNMNQAISHDNGITDLTIFSTLEPCLMCYGAILIHNIQTIVYAYEDVMGGGTCCKLNTLSPLYAKKKVEIIPHVLRKESLSLFQRYFSNPESNYLKDTLLCHYTLKQ